MKEYIGNELELFKHAHNWKNYYAKFIKTYLQNDVLEVGAGIGETTHSLCDGTQKSWLCVEPDEKLIKELVIKKDNGYLPPLVEIKLGTLDNLVSDCKFDAVIYIDVIEHIENDKEELEKASSFLKPGGKLIVLVPAHNYLFSEFDKSIGHYRRYNKKMLIDAAPKELIRKNLRYLDSVGLFASLANKWFLKQDYPELKQIKFWDNVIIPISKITDFISFYCIGKTVIGIWEKNRMNKELKKIVCLTPVYNDWESFSILVDTIYKTYCKQNRYVIEIVAINDGSIEENEAHSNPIPIEIINLKVNVGHQRAIAIGLQYINDTKFDFDYVVVLDSDGEDKPEDVAILISEAERFNDKKIIFAQRKKRSESLFFKIGYFFYKHIFYGLTGQKINFGNFSCIPKRLLKRIVVQENLWNHYSGSIIQSKTPFEKVLLDRGKRYAGHSKMNFTSLILHGLSSISVYFDSLSVRILKLSLFGVLLCFLSVISILYIKFLTNQSIPGWASSLILIIFGIILQLFSVTLIVLLLQLSSRKKITAPNTRIYLDFIESIENGQSL